MEEVMIAYCFCFDNSFYIRIPTTTVYMIINNICIYTKIPSVRQNTKTMRVFVNLYLKHFKNATCNYEIAKMLSQLH